MIRCALLLLMQLPLIAFAQQLKAVHFFKPINADGFNSDVIVESPEPGPISSTSTEIGGNFVLFSQAYAKAKGMESGLPDNGKVTYKNRVYQLKKFTESNALYLLRGAQGVLSFDPVKFDVISLLGFATEGKATVSVTILFSEGPPTIKSVSLNDWIDGPNPALKGIGRLKREDGPTQFEGAPENPRMYEVSIDLPEEKEIRGLMIRNISGGAGDQNNRVVIFAVSGYNREWEKAPVKKDSAVVETLKELEELPVEVGVHVSLNNVLFKQSTAVLLDQSYGTLDSVSSFLIKNPSIKIEVAGHTDAHGHAKANLTLSRERAVAIKKYLVKGGVVSDRITAKGYGGSKPVAPNDTEEHRRLNRRVEFVILSK